MRILHTRYYYYYVLWSGRAPPRDPNSQPLISPPLSTSLLLYYHNTATTLQLFFFSSLLFFLFFFSLLRASSCLLITPDFRLSLSLSLFPLLSSLSFSPSSSPLLYLLPIHNLLFFVYSLSFLFNSITCVTVSLLLSSRPSYSFLSLSLSIRISLPVRRLGGVCACVCVCVVPAVAFAPRTLFFAFSLPSLSHSLRRELFHDVSSLRLTTTEPHDFHRQLRADWQQHIWQCSVAELQRQSFVEAQR